MNPILLKTLISLAASNNKPAASGTVGSDAQLKNRTVLFSDEATDFPEWGISGLPAMILGAAPQTCLFVGDLTANTPDEDSTPSGESKDNTPGGGPSGETVSFSLTIKSPPEEGSSLSARTIVWKLTVPVAGHRDVQTTANSPSVRAPVIKTQIKLGGIKRDVEVGLLEMSGLDQPLLIGKDTLGDKFLIRPDRPEDAKTPKPPSVDLTQKPVETAQPQDGSDESDTPKPDASTSSTADQSTPDPTATSTPAAQPAADTVTTSDDSSDGPATGDTDDTSEARVKDAPQGDTATSSNDTTTSNSDEATTPTKTSGTSTNTTNAARDDTPAPETPKTETLNQVATTDTADASDTDNKSEPSTPDTTTPGNNAASQTETTSNTATEDKKPATKPAPATETTPAQ